MDNNPVQVKSWRLPYKYRRKRINALGISTKQMAWSQVFSLVGSIVAGVLLESNKTTLALLAGAFVILPGVFDLDGSLGAVLSAKINHRMEDLEARVWRIFISSTAFALFVAVLAGLVVAVFGASLATIFFNAHFWDVFLAGFGTIVLSGVIGLPIIGVLSVFFRKQGMNPDDVVGPIESSIFDILTVITLTMMVQWIV